ncbi:hypothetical protein ES703_00026 [subsurface metagenome]
MVKMVRVAQYGRPHPKITESVIPEAARDKETYLGGVYEGTFELQYSPRLPTPREAVVALSYAIDKFEVEHPGVVVTYAEIVHPSDLEMAAGSVPSCRFQFVTEHHSPFLVSLLLLGIAAAVAAGIAYGTTMAVMVIAAVLLVLFLIAAADYVVNHIWRGPTLKCPKCGRDFDYLGVGAITAHWRAEHSDQEEPDWQKMEDAYERSQVGQYVIWGLVGVGGVVTAYWAFKRISRKKEPKRAEVVERGKS